MSLTALCPPLLPHTAGDCRHAGPQHVCPQHACTHTCKCHTWASSLACFYSQSCNSRVLQNHEASPWKNHQNTTAVKSSPICPVQRLFGECKFFARSLRKPLSQPHFSAPATPQNHSQFLSSGRSCWSTWTSPSAPFTSCFPKGHGCSQHLSPYSTEGTGIHQSCQEHCVPPLSNNQDAFNLQCQTLQYWHPQNPPLLLPWTQGLKNHQGDAFEYLSTSHVNCNSAVSSSIPLSFTVLKSIGIERSWAWFQG